VSVNYSLQNVTMFSCTFLCHLPFPKRLKSRTYSLAYHRFATWIIITLQCTRQVSTFRLILYVALISYNTTDTTTDKLFQVDVFWVMTPRSVVVVSSPWRWRQHGPPKRWYLTTTLHGVTTETWNFSAVKASKIAIWATAVTLRLNSMLLETLLPYCFLTQHR
jgi:hypothetical protein